jgi:hypothetical protein
MEYYLSHPDRNVRLILTKFRLSEHKLLIEIYSRNLKIPRDQILCAICNVLEDEFNFCFECRRNTNYRNISKFQNIYSNFIELNHEEKLTKILNPSTAEQIRTVTKCTSFIRQSLQGRIQGGGRKLFAPPSARRNFFMCAPPNLKFWIRPCIRTERRRLITAIIVVHVIVFFYVVMYALFFFFVHVYYVSKL